MTPAESRDLGDLCCEEGAGVFGPERKKNANRFYDEQIYGRLLDPVTSQCCFLINSSNCFQINLQTSRIII